MCFVNISGKLQETGVKKNKSRKLETSFIILISPFVSEVRKDYE